MIIEIVDDAEKIDRFFPFLDEHLHEGLVTVEDATVMIYRHSNGEKKRSGNSS